MKVTYTQTSRDEAVTALGPHWPARPGATVALIGETVAVTHGALSVNDADGQPGITWWVADGLIVPQDAGPAPQLPGCRLETVPEPTVDDAPPLT